jgi:hypothetical protein
MNQTETAGLPTHCQTDLLTLTLKRQPSLDRSGRHQLYRRRLFTDWAGAKLKEVSAIHYLLIMQKCFETIRLFAFDVVKQTFGTSRLIYCEY